MGVGIQGVGTRFCLLVVGAAVTSQRGMDVGREVTAAKGGTGCMGQASRPFLRARAASPFLCLQDLLSTVSGTLQISPKTSVDQMNNQRAPDISGDVKGSGNIRLTLQKGLENTHRSGSSFSIG